MMILSSRRQQGAATVQPRRAAATIQHRLAAAVVAVASVAGLVSTTATPAQAASTLWQTTSATRHAQGALGGISCVGSFCMSVGSKGYGDQVVAQAQVLSGSRFASTKLTPYAGKDGVRLLDAVSCTSSTFCIATGGDPIESTQDVIPVVLRWNGKDWTKQTLPVTSGEVLSVSCTASNFCLAVVSSETDTVVKWNGSSWSKVAAPTTSSLQSITCRSASFCMAVGAPYADNVAHSMTPMAALWNGSSWKLTALAKPAGWQWVEMFGVTCPSTSVCYAGGDMVKQDADGNTIAQPYALQWKNTSWTAMPVAGLSSTGEVGISSLSCTSTTACVAVGMSDQKSQAPVWGLYGSSWKLQSAPVLMAPQLTGVARSSNGHFYAVGQLFASGAEPSELAVVR